MAIDILDGFNVGSSNPIDSRLKVADLTELDAMEQSKRPIGQLIWVTSEGKFYQWTDSTTREEFISGGSGGSSLFFVSKDSGDDSTAELGNPQLPYLTINAATNAAKTEFLSTGVRQRVYVMEGTYYERNICRLGVDLFFDDKTIVWSDELGNFDASIIDDLDGTGEYNVYGRGRFYIKTPNHGDDREAINFRNGSEVYIEAKEVCQLQFWSGVTTAELHIDSVIFNYTTNNYNKYIDFHNTSFKTGVWLAPFNGGSITKFHNCTFELPENGYDDYKEVYDYDSNLLFTFDTSQPDFNDSQWLDTSSLTLQETVDSVNTTKTIGGWFGNPSQHFRKSAFLFAEVISHVNLTQIYFYNCTIDIYKDKGVGLEYMQLYDDNGYAPDNGREGLLYIDGLLINDRSQAGFDGGDTCALAISMDAAITKPKLISLDGIKHNCSEAHLIPSGTAQVSTFSKIPESFSNVPSSGGGENVFWFSFTVSNSLNRAQGSALNMASVETNSGQINISNTVYLKYVNVYESFGDNVDIDIRTSFNVGDTILTVSDVIDSKFTTLNNPIELSNVTIRPLAYGASSSNGSANCCVKIGLVESI